MVMKSDDNLRQVLVKGRKVPSYAADSKVGAESSLARPPVRTSVGILRTIF
jgi:hypothetical protein